MGAINLAASNNQISPSPLFLCTALHFPSKERPLNFYLKCVCGKFIPRLDSVSIFTSVFSVIGIKCGGKSPNASVGVQRKMHTLRHKKPAAHLWRALGAFPGEQAPIANVPLLNRTFIGRRLHRGDKISPVKRPQWILRNFNQMVFSRGLGKSRLKVSTKRQFFTRLFAEIIISLFFIYK